MKKLMIALAAAATTMFSFGDDVLPHGADFEAEGYVAGENFTNYVNKAEDGVATSGNRYWYSTSEDIGVISNHQEISVKSVPDLYENATPTGGVKYLQLDTQVPLFRTIKDNGQQADFTGVDMSTGDGVYLDTLVKFTAADAAFGTDALEEAVDKIAIEYVEREIEYGTGDEAAVVKVTPLTNFVVRAGFIGSAFATNYLVDVPDGWLENNMKDDWHRLTVRALTNIDGNNRAGFKIYLDEEPLVYRTDKDEFAQSAGFEDDTHMIFPSAVASGVNKTTISAVAFSGNGSIDDVVFTTTKPKFIAKSEAVVVPFVADAGVTAITVTVAGVTDPISVVDGEATLPAQTTDFTVNVTVDEANGYTLGGISYGGTPVVDGEVTGYTGGDITITTIRNNFNLFDENGDPIQGTFQTLTDAFAAEGVAKIKLAYDYDVLAVEGDEFAGYTVDGEVILDLAGNDLVGGDDSAGVSLFTATDTFTIIDSIGGGSITYDTQYTDNAIVNLTGSDAFIGAATGDAGATFNGKLFNIGFEGKIIKGSIDDASNAVAGEFLWANYVDSNSTLSDGPTAGYWVVTPKGGSTTFALTTTGGANATITTDPVDVSALTEETEVTITSTPETGYTYNGVDLTDTGFTYDSESGTISRTLIVTTDTEVAVPGAVAQQLGTYTVTVTPTANATYAAAYKSDDSAITPDNDVLTVTVGQTIVITATPAANYEYATTPDGWTAGQDGEITIEVSEAGTVAIPAPTEKGGKTYPSYIDDAEKTKYDTWAAYAEISAADFPDATGSNEEAYLLNCKPSEVADAKAAFKFTAFDQANPKDTTKTTTTTSYNGRDYNGTVVIKQYSDVGCTTESATGTFFRAVLQ